MEETRRGNLNRLGKLFVVSMHKASTLVDSFNLTKHHLALNIVCVAAAIAWLVFHHNINWDEFHYLSKVHQYVNGEPLVALQTFHVHLYRWITLLPMDEIVQVSTARLTTLILLLCTATLVYAIARSFVAPYYAMCGSLAYLASGFVVGHGASFRPDPIAACLLMLALYLAFSTRLVFWQICLLAISLATAALVTIKAVLFAPAFLAAVIWRRNESGLMAKILFTTVAAAAFFLVLFMAHDGLLTVNNREAVELAKNAVDKVVLSGEFMPRLPTIQLWLVLSMGSLTLVIAGFTGVKKNSVVCLLLVLPMFSILFYRNAYPYFFPFISPPLMVVAAIGANKLAKRHGLLSLVIVMMSTSAAGQIWFSYKEDQQVQRELLTVVHDLFPQPVPYIDSNSMVATFPKVGIFMSSWGVENYRKANTPVFEKILSSQYPPFLLTNGAALSAAMYGIDNFSRCCGLLEPDIAVLRKNYVRYWRDLWLVGKKLQASGEPQNFDMPIAGKYRMSAENTVVIDNRVVEPGQSIYLSAGEHNITSITAQKLTIIWDSPPPPDGSRGWWQIYAGFWKL